MVHAGTFNDGLQIAVRILYVASKNINIKNTRHLQLHTRECECLASSSSWPNFIKATVYVIIS